MAAVARILAVVRGAVVNKPMLHVASCPNVRANVVMVLQSAPQEVHDDDLTVVDEVTTMEDSGDEDNDEDGHSLGDNDI